jgi:hypothetical protein
MSGIFPSSADGGLAPNPADPNNPKNAFPPILPPNGTAALYYGNGCDVRLRPEVVNSLISEIAATVDEAKLNYNPAKLENLEHAVRYLIQRGLALSGTALGGPYDYTLALDPTATGYNNFMTLCIVPENTNAGPVRLNVDGFGLVPVLRNDGAPLVFDDLRAGIPVLIDYQAGVFYVVHMVRSQVPFILMTGDVDCWIRTDGNDLTGDGTTNTPEKAFRTINGAWLRMGKRYLPSLIYSINMRLGIPGDYEAGAIGPFGGRVALYGNPSGPGDNYRIKMTAPGVGAYNLAINNVTMYVENVNFLLSLGAGYEPWCVNITNGAQVWLKNCIWTASANPAGKGGYISVAVNSSLVLQGTIDMRGGGTSIQTAIALGKNAISGGALPQSGNSLICTNTNFATAFIMCQAHSFASFEFAGSNGSGSSGPRYLVFDLAILYMFGLTLPGSTAGTTGTGGLAFP